MILLEDQGQVVIVHIRMPNIDNVSAREIAQVCDRTRKTAVLDFAEVLFINSAGITGLLRFIVNARRQGHRVYAIHVNQHHRKVFKMVELSRFMPIIEESEMLAFT